jgi:hypothetical protein
MDGVAGNSVCPYLSRSVEAALAMRLRRPPHEWRIFTVDNVVPRRPFLVRFYRSYLCHQDSARFIKNVNRHYGVATLQRLVSTGGPILRRASVLAIGFVGDYGSNTVIGRAMVDRDRGVRSIAERSIRDLWCRVGSRSQRQSLRNVIRLNHDKKFGDGVRIATELIHDAPWIAEAWCQRGMAYYHLSEYTQAVCDCREALEINPYHFTAAAGMGQCFLLENSPAPALEAFRVALRLNPGMEEVRTQVIQLQRGLESD